MNYTYLYLFLALLAGAMMPTQAAVNNKMAAFVESPVLSAFISFLVGTAALFEDNQIRRVAVVDGSGACCGIVAQADIAVNASGQKTAEVVQEVSKATA